MKLISKVVLLTTAVAFLKYGFNAQELKAILKTTATDYKKAAVSAKDYVQGKDNEEELISEIKAINKDLNNLMDSYDFNNAKTEVKKRFITLTDFIFNGGEIKGVKFNDLTSVSKEVVLDIYNALDTKIKTKYPNYKEAVSEKVETAKTYAEEKVTEAIGEENYNNIKEKVVETKDKVVDKTKETYSKVKDKAKEWYNNYKNK